MSLDLIFEVEESHTSSVQVSSELKATIGLPPDSISIRFWGLNRATTLMVLFDMMGGWRWAVGSISSKAVDLGKRRKSLSPGKRLSLVSLDPKWRAPIAAPPRMERGAQKEETKQRTGNR